MPGFLANSNGFFIRSESAEPKINPLASIAIIASELIIESKFAISWINSVNKLGSFNIVKTSLNKIPFLGKSG